MLFCFFVFVITWREKIKSPQTTCRGETDTLNWELSQKTNLEGNLQSVTSTLAFVFRVFKYPSSFVHLHSSLLFGRKTSLSIHICKCTFLYSHYFVCLLCLQISKTFSQSRELPRWFEENGGLFSAMFKTSKLLN